MEIKLILRTSSAYYSQPRIVLADNEQLTIQLIDKGQVTQIPALVTSHGVYVFDNGKLTLTAEQIGDCLTATVQDREANSNKVISRWTCENLYRLPSTVGEESEELLTEREFYKNYIARLIEDITALQSEVESLTTRVYQLENGKFTLFKPKEDIKQ